MDYLNGLPKWTTPKWTTAKNNIPNEYYLMFLAASRLKLYIYKFRGYVHPVHVDHIGKSTVTMQMLTLGNH